jgi:hypothetical protein
MLVSFIIFKSELNAIHEYLESWSYFDWFCGALANENLQIADQPMRSLWADLTQRIPAKTKCFQNGFLWYFKPTKQLPLPLPVPSRLCTVLPLGCLSGCLLTRNPETSPGFLEHHSGCNTPRIPDPNDPTLTCTNKPQHDENRTAHAPTTLVLHHCARPYRGPQGKDSKRETKPDMLFGKKRFLFWPHAWKHGQIDSCDMMLSVMACDGEQLNQSPDVHSWLSGSCSMNMPRRAILWPYHHIPPLGSPVRWPIRRNSRMASWDRCAGMDGPRNILIQNTAAVNPLRPWSVTSGVASGRGTLLEIKSQWASERC